MEILQLKNISKTFSVKGSFLSKNIKRVRAVDQIDLTVIRGENLGIVGESGSGKSTLARVIMKLYPADSGKIIFQNEDYTKYSGKKLKKIYQHIQLVFQDPYSSLDPRMTVRRILLEAIGLVEKEYPTAEKKNEKLIEVLRAVKLDESMLNRYPHEFSGGERQRLAIARALVVRPKVLILDEAVSSLDVITQAQILDLLAEIKKKYELTYIFISHNLRVIRRICDRVAVMVQGKIVELAPAKRLFEHPEHLYTKELLASAIDFKPTDRSHEVDIPSDAVMVNMGEGHFVLKGKEAN